MTRKRYEKDIKVLNGPVKIQGDKIIIDKENELEEVSNCEEIPEEQWLDYKYRDYEGEPQKIYKFFCYGCYEKKEAFGFQCERTGKTFCSDCAFGIYNHGKFYSEEAIFEKTDFEE